MSVATKRWKWRNCGFVYDEALGLPEDGIAPGNYESVARPFIVPGLAAPTDVAHHNTQFRAAGGYLASLPCPESGAAVAGVTSHRNGWAGAFGIVAQKPQPDGSLWVVCQCTGCGALWRADAESAERIVVAFRAEADRCATYDPTDARIRTYHGVADRVMAGYSVAQEA